MLFLISLPFFCIFLGQALCFSLLGNLPFKNAFQISKRGFDVTASVTLLLLFSPLLLILCLLSRIIMGFPIFFRQQRVGKAEQIFWIIKFRSMPLSSFSLQDPATVQLSWYGKFLRYYSLDELPSLLNILKGDMSFVGPRPLVPEFYVTSIPKVRSVVLPGLTGLAQINGRNNLKWKHRFRYDTWYVRHQSWALELIILFKTIPLSLSGHGTELACEEEFSP